MSCSTSYTAAKLELKDQHVMEVHQVPQQQSPQVHQVPQQQSQQQSPPQNQEDNIESSSANHQPVETEKIEYITFTPVEYPQCKYRNLDIPDEIKPLHVWLRDKPFLSYLGAEQKENYMKICIPLYNAAVKGDWHSAETIINDHPDVITNSITNTEDTILHVVSCTQHTHFAEKLVDKMKAEELEFQNQQGETALWLAVGSSVKMVEILLKKNIGLLKIRKNGHLPFLCAVWYGDKDMVAYVYSKTNLADGYWNESDLNHILSSCLAFGLYDIALKILKHYKTEGILTIDTAVLKNLADKPSAFNTTMQPFLGRLLNAIFPGPRLAPIENSKLAVEIVRIMWGEIVYKLKHEDIVKQTADNDLLFKAARLGNYKFIIELLRLYPDITWDTDHNGHTIFHVAVLHRQENVYNLLSEFGSKKLGMIDRFGNNILHLAALKPAQSRLNIVSGAALQMQRELLWFEEVQTSVSSVERTWINNYGKSPQETFTEEHADLMEKGESWMKKTAAQCMVVAALITTIMFAAAFTLPGGNNQEKGYPIFMKKSAFKVFVVTDAISLCTSSTSILMFLAILTSRYAENDFLVSLPMKLMVGLLTLFISISTMMIAFSASFFLLYAKTIKWIPVLVTVSAGLPVILFARLQYRLLFDVIDSTFNSRHLFRPRKRLLY